MRGEAHRIGTVECVALILIVALAAVAGIAARTWDIFAEPLWLDEAYSAYAAGHDLAFLWHVVPRYETHPPFYYTLLHFWEGPFGDGLGALRSLGLIAGLATPAVVAWTAVAIADRLGWARRRKLWLVAAAFGFACLSIPLVQMTREVRPYPLMILVYALAIRALLALHVARTLRSRAYPAYLLCLALLLWLHNLGPFYAAALGAALLVTVRPRDWALLVGGHALVALAYIPALLILLDQAPTWIASTWVGFAWRDLWKHLAILYAVPGWQAISAGVLVVLGVVALLNVERRLMAMLLILALLPVALSVAISIAVSPVFITRTMTPVVVPTLLLLAIGATAWQGWRVWLGASAAAMLVANLAAVDVQARKRGPMQDWYGTIGWLQQRFRPGDLILAYPNEAALPMARALGDKGLAWPVRAIPAPVPAFGEGGWHPTGSRGVVSLSPDRLHAIATDPAIEAVQTIWLLRLSAEAYDKGDIFWHELAHDRRMVRRWRDGGIDVIGLRRITPPPAPAPYRR